MQGLMMVRSPPAKATASNSIVIARKRQAYETSD
jgi:hypothetical protein